MRYDRKVSACVNRETKTQISRVCQELEISESKFVRVAIQAYLRSAYHIVEQASESGVAK